MIFVPSLVGSRFESMSLTLSAANGSMGSFATLAIGLISDSRKKVALRELVKGIFSLERQLNRNSMD